MARTLPTLTVLVALVGCDAGPPVRACPSLEVGGWTWFGVVGPPGSASPNERVRLYYPGDERWGDAWYATPNGSFALRAAGRWRRGQDAVLEIGRSRYDVHPGPSEALIEYDAGSHPVVESAPGFMTFTGWLHRTSHSTSPAAARAAAAASTWR